MLGSKLIGFENLVILEDAFRTISEQKYPSILEYINASVLEDHLIHQFQLANLQVKGNSSLGFVLRR